MTNGRFLALEGSDGAGKSTLARHLADLTYEQAVHLLIHESDVDPAHRLVFVSRRQISATSPYSATLMDHIATMLWHSGDSPDLPDRRGPWALPVYRELIRRGIAWAAQRCAF